MALTKLTSRLIHSSLKTAISGSDTSESSSFSARVTRNETTHSTNINQSVKTTASPTFAGGNVTGDFTVGGTLTAQEIHTEFTSASILFDSGSTKFGDSGDDIHHMTGSLKVSGSFRAETSQIQFFDDNTEIAVLENSSENLKIESKVQDKDIIFSGNDGGAGIEAMRIDMSEAGRVGIGDSSPGSPLDVKSSEAANTANFNSTSGATNITFESNGSLIGQMEFLSAGPSQIVTRTSASLALGSNNVQTLFINDSDNVGIGETSPDGKLHIKQSTDNGNAIVVDSGTDGGRIDVLTVQEAGAERWHLSFEGNSSTNDLTLNSNSTNNILNIEPGGNVGIGTNNANALLQISGSGLNGAPTLAIDNTSTSSYIHSIEALGGAMTANQINIINLGKIGSTKNSGVIGYKWVSAGSDDNLLTFEHWGTGPLTTINGKGKVTINADASGDYGCFINNSNSGGYGLRIAGGASSADYLIRGQNEGGTDKFVVKSDGSTTFSGGITGPTDTHMSYTAGQATDTASGGAFHAEGSDVIAGRYFFQGYNADGGKLVGVNNESDQLVMYNYYDGNYMAKFKYGGDFYPMADVIMASGRGISFAADGNHGAMESELLDDYEEGTWEPTFEPQNNSYTSITYQSDTGGRYTKIGNLVVCQGCVRYDSINIGSATGYLYIGGFPFTSRGRTNGDNDDSPFILFSTANGNNWNSNNKLPLWGYRGVNNTRASLYYQASVGSAPVIVNVSDQGTTGYNRIHFVCVYHSTV